MIGSCIGNGGEHRSGSLKQREGVNSHWLRQFCFILLLHPGNKVKSESNPEIGVEPVGISLPYDYLLLPEESCNLGCVIAPNFTPCSS